MKFKATQSEIDRQEAREAAKRAEIRGRKIVLGSKWKPPSPLHCKNYGCEEMADHELVFWDYYRDGSALRIRYCRAHAWSVHKIMKGYRELKLSVERIK